MHDERTERDLILFPNEYAFVLDGAKGLVQVYVGPKMDNLGAQDQPVIFNEDTKRFEGTSLERAKQLFCAAPEGWYVILKNPAENPEKPHPANGALNDAANLDIGRKINIQGPSSFALFPGQMARVVRGHQLRSNQYLIVNVYDAEAARASWSDAVVELAEDSDSDGTSVTADPPQDLRRGDLLLIKGTEVSFYIPPTGLEVVREGTDYVRDAVTLETLEYCILLNENGEKRFVRGNAVVFPEPNEIFLKKGGKRKFRAIELNELQGLYIKVTAQYTDADGTEHKEGDELFLTGKDQMLYFPRAEHAIIQRDGQGRRHYAIAIPEGEARYVLNRTSGEISLVAGSTMFLPDPRKHVVVRRVLSRHQVELLYPGNREALLHNQNLQGVMEETNDQVLREHMVSNRNPHGVSKSSMRSHKLFDNSSSSSFDDDWLESAGDAEADSFQRGATYTKPPMITIDSKYDGAVSVSVWTGYAMLLVRKNGDRRVVVGPQTVLLEYDEIPEVFSMSTGKPKTTDHLLKTTYLRVRNNKISDIIKVVTSDRIHLAIKVSYRVDFVGDSPEQWFEVENYVKFLCDHMRSVVRNRVRQYPVEEFEQNAIAIVRDVIIGDQREDGSREGRLFSENNMKISDVEVLTTEITDKDIGHLLVESQHSVVRNALDLERERRGAALASEVEVLKRTRHELESDTRLMEIKLRAERDALKADNLVAEQLAEQKFQDLRKNVAETVVARKKVMSDYEDAKASQEQALIVDLLRARTAAYEKRAAAVSGDLIAALQVVGDKISATEISKNIAPMAYIGGESIGEVLSRVLGGVLKPEALQRALSTGGNGKATSIPVDDLSPISDEESY